MIKAQDIVAIKNDAEFEQAALEEIAKVEMMPKLDGKKMNMMLAPKGKK